MKALQLLCVGAAVLVTGLSRTASAQITAEPVEYKSGDVVCEGWRAYAEPKTKKRSAVLIVPQWTGISDHEKESASKLAEMGYNVLVADIYGKGIRPQPPEAGKEAGKYKNDRKLFRERLEAAMAVLSKDEATDASRIVAIGYCFGGTGVLELARSGADVKAVVSFHGGLSTPTPDDARNIKCPVLVCHGADDPYVPAAEVEAFHKEMKAANVRYDFVSYPDAVHAFTQKGAGNDNSKGAAYNKDADEKSWQAMKDFFFKALQ